MLGTPLSSFIFGGHLRVFYLLGIRRGSKAEACQRDQASEGLFHPNHRIRLGSSPSAPAPGPFDAIHEESQTRRTQLYPRLRLVARLKVRSVQAEVFVCTALDAKKTIKYLGAEARTPR